MKFSDEQKEQLKVMREKLKALSDEISNFSLAFEEDNEPVFDDLQDAISCVDTAFDYLDLEALQEALEAE